MKEFFFLIIMWMLATPLAGFVFLSANGEMTSKEVLAVVASASTGFLFGALAWILVRRTEDD